MLLLQSHSPFMNVTLPNRTIYWVCNNMCNITGATCGAESAYPSRAHEITPSFWWGTYCFVLSFLCCVMCTTICLFVFIIFSHGVVSLFSIYEFDCPSGIFRLSFINCFAYKRVFLSYNLIKGWHPCNIYRYFKQWNCFARQLQWQHHTFYFSSSVTCKMLLNKRSSQSFRN